MVLLWQNGWSQSATDSTESLNNGIVFIENKGQISDQYFNPRPDVLFSSEHNGLVYHLKKDGISYQQYKVDTWRAPFQTSPDEQLRRKDSIPNEISTYRVDLNWIGANSDFTVTRGGSEPGFSNYYLPACPQGATKVKSYTCVEYKGLFNGVDMKWYRHEGMLKYDFIVAPYANYKNIRWQVEGAELSIHEGDLVLETPYGQIREKAPVAFQNGEVIAVKWKQQNNVVSFQLGSYDPTLAVVIDPAVVRVWGTYYGGSDWDDVRHLDGDHQANVYMSGHTQSTSNIATTGTFKSTKVGTDKDAFLAKFDRNGVRVWATYYGSTGIDRGMSSTTGHDLTTYLAGLTRSTSNISSTGTHQTSSGGGIDAFLVKLDSTGARKWATYYGGTLNDEFGDCSTDDSLNVYVVGRTLSTTGIATTGGLFTKLKGTESGFAVKFDSTGQRQWGTYYGEGYANKCAIDDSSNFYFTGAIYTDSMATPGVHQDTIWNLRDMYLTKLDRNGKLRWCTYFGGPGSDASSGCAVDKSYNVYLTGIATSDTGIATTGAHQPKRKGMDDAFLCKFNNRGQRVWATYYGGTGYQDFGMGVAVDTNSNVYLSGFTESTTGISTKGAHQEILNTTVSGCDGFLAKFNSSGVRQWGTYYGGEDDDWGCICCFIDDSSYAYLCGTTASKKDLSTAGSYQSNLSGSMDAFLAKFKSCEPYYFSDTVISCKPYTSPTSSSIWSQTGVYYDSLITGAGCDSIYTIHLTILELRDTIQVKACDSFASPSGKYLWTTSGTYTDTVINSLGCDSILSIELTVAKSSTASVSVSSCAGIRSSSTKYFWNTTGVYTDTLMNTQGCDSVITVNLMVKNTKASFTTTACDSLVSPSGKYHWIKSGTYFDTIKNAAGCDSLLTYMLTVDTSTTARFSIKRCSTYISPSGKIWVSTGVYTDTLPNAKGCDSVITLELSIQNTSARWVDTTCDIYRSPSGKYSWTNSGTYMDTMPNAAGCDSVITIDLVVLRSTTSYAQIKVCEGLLSPSSKYYWDSTGTYYDTLHNAKGCDSLITVDLEVQRTFAKLVLSACDSLLAPSGNYVWTTSGTYVDTLTNTSNCDSIITIQLSVLASSGSVIYDTVCAIYTSPSGKYNWTSSGVYLDTLKNAAGCDSIIEVNLQILRSTKSSLAITACDSFAAPSKRYTWTNSGTYTDTLINYVGCDSIITIELNIRNSTLSNTRLGLCGGSFLSPSGKHLWTSEGVFYDTIVNVAGCDSFMTIILVESEEKRQGLNWSVCDSVVAPSGKDVWKLSGRYIDTLSTVLGCDSILTIDLKVNSSTSSRIDTVVCDFYRSPAGSTKTLSGIYNDTLLGFRGCDSVITIHLRVNKSAVTNLIGTPPFTTSSGKILTTEGTFFDTLTTRAGCDSILIIVLENPFKRVVQQLSVTVCDSFVSPVGKTVWYESGDFKDSVVWEDSSLIYEIRLQVLETRMEVERTGNLLEVISEADSVQWLRCRPEYESLENEQEVVFHPRASGYYAVQVSKDGCSTVSDCYLVFMPGVFPNPTTDKVTVDLGVESERVDLIVTDAIGKKVAKYGFGAISSFEIELPKASGVYFLQLELSSGERRLHKIVKVK